MRILYHHRTLGDGAEGIHIAEMVRAFRLLGHQVLVAGPVGEQVSGGRESAARLGKLKRVLPRALFECLEAGYSLVCFLDLVLKSTAYKPDFIYDRYITFNAGALLAARWVKVPLVLEVNAPLALERSTEPDERLHLKSLARALERLVCSKADHTVVVSTPLKQYLESQGVPREKCIVMPNGVDHRKFTPRPKSRELQVELGIPADATVVGFTGILRPWHGLEMLINSVKMLREEGRSVYLLIVGDGPIRGNLEAVLSEAGLSKDFCITGRVPHASVADYANLFDIAVSPKATFYASPMKIMEYMALGKVVVAPDTANLRDVIVSGETGMLFRNGATESLAETLSSLIATPSARAEMGRRAREVVETRLNWGWNASEVCMLVRQRQTASEGGVLCQQKSASP